MRPLRSSLYGPVPFRMARLFRGLTASAILLFLAGCGGAGGGAHGRDGPSGSDALLRVTVEPSDEAQTFSAEGTVSVTVPGGMLAEAQTLEVRRVDGPGYVPMAEAETGGVIEVSLGDQETFDQELILEFPVDLGGLNPEVPAPVQVHVASWDDAAGVWVFEPAEVDVEAGVARVRTHHLSGWAWFTSFAFECVTSEYGNFNVCYDPGIEPVFRDDTSLSIDEFAETVGGYLEHASARYAAAGFDPPDFYPLDVVVYEAALTDDGERKEAPYYSPNGGSIYFSMKHFSSLDEVRHDTAHELFHAFQNQDITAWGMAHRFWFTEAMAEAAANRVAWGFGDTAQLMPLGSGFFSVPLSSEEAPHPYEAGHFADYLIAEVGVDPKGLWDSVADEWEEPVDVGLQWSVDFIKVWWATSLEGMSDYLRSRTGVGLGGHWQEFVHRTFFSSPPVFADINPNISYFVAASDAFQRIRPGTTHAEEYFVVPGGYGAKFWAVDVEPEEGETSREIQVVPLGAIPDRILVSLYLVRDGESFTEGSEVPLGTLESGVPGPRVSLEEGDYLIVLLVSFGGEESQVVLAVSDALDGDLGENPVVPAGGSLTLDPGVTGGTPPYRYEWTLEGEDAGTGETLTIDHQDLAGPAWVEVRVTDAHGLLWTAGTTVSPEDVETRVSFPDHSGRWTVTLTFPEGQGTGYRMVPEEEVGDSVYGWGELVEVELGGYPAAYYDWPEATVPVKLTLSGEAVSSWYLFPASNTRDPASRNTTAYWKDEAGPMSLRGDRYYWLYIYPESGAYSLEVLRIRGNAHE